MMTGLSETTSTASEVIKMLRMWESPWHDVFLPRTPQDRDISWRSRQLIAGFVENPGRGASHPPDLLKRKLHGCNHGCLQKQNVFLQKQSHVETAAGLSDKECWVQKSTGPAAPLRPSSRDCDAEWRRRGEMKPSPRWLEKNLAAAVGLPPVHQSWPSGQGKGKVCQANARLPCDIAVNINSLLSNPDGTSGTWHTLICLMLTTTRGARVHCLLLSH